LQLRRYKAAMFGVFSFVESISKICLVQLLIFQLQFPDLILQKFHLASNLFVLLTVIFSFQGT